MKRLRRGWRLLALLGAAIAIAGVVVRHVLFHTSLGLGAIASILTRSGIVEFEGLEGTLGSGFRAHRISVRSAGRPPSEIEDLNVSYRLEGWIHRGLVVEEVSVGRATLYVDSGPDRPGDPEPDDDSTTGGRALEFLRIERISLHDIGLLDPARDYELAIREVEWRGFRIGGGAFDPGTLEVESDRVEVETLPADIVHVDGVPIEFQRRFVAAIKPAPLSRIRDVIDLDLRISATGGERTTFLLRAFAEALEVRLDTELKGFVRTRELDLTRYFTSDSRVLPSSLTLELGVAPDSAGDFWKLDLRSAAFRLGTIDFTEEPRTIVLEPGRNPLVTRARGPGGDHEYVHELILDVTNESIEQRFGSEPAQEPREVLSHVLFGKPFADLDGSEVKALEEKMRHMSGANGVRAREDTNRRLETSGTRWGGRRTDHE